jgi:hypothetical protein
MSTLLIFLAGLFVGWNFKQPAYAKFIQDKVVAYFRNTGK